MKMNNLPAEVVNAIAGLSLLSITLLAAAVTSYFVIGWLGMSLNPGFFIGLLIPYVILFFIGDRPRHIKTLWFYWFKYDGNGFPAGTYLSEEQKSAHGVINACNNSQNSKKPKVKSLLDD